MGDKKDKQKCPSRFDTVFIAPPTPAVSPPRYVNKN